MVWLIVSLFWLGLITLIMRDAFYNFDPLRAPSRPEPTPVEIDDQELHRRTERQFWRHQKTHNHLVTIFSAAAAIAAAITTIVAGYAYVESRRQADAAWDQVSTARETEHKQLRAYVSVKVPNPIRNFGPNQTAELEIVLQNSGQTPALDTVVTGILFLRPYPLPDAMDLTIPNSQTKTESGRGITLSPRDENVGIRLEREIAPAVHDAAVEGKIARYYAFGTVRYRDVFSIEHWSHFCISFYGEGLKRWDYCPRYNDADQIED